MKKFIFTLFLLLISIGSSISNSKKETSFKVSDILDKEVITARCLYNNTDYDTVVLKLKEWEGFWSMSYKDTKGWAIGYGHSIRRHERHSFMKAIDEQRATKILKEDLDYIITLAHRKTGLKGKQLLALSALMYNTGTKKFYTSTLFRYIKEENPKVRSEWLKWCHFRKNGVYVKSAHLLKRRRWEVAYYELGCKEYGRYKKPI